MIRKLTPQEGWGSLALLVVLILWVGWTIEATDWTRGLYVLKWAAVLGACFGFLLTRAKWPQGLVHAFSIILGLAVILSLNLHLTGLEFRKGMLVLASRFQQWLEIAMQGGRSTDNIAFLLLMVALLWVLGYLSSWYLFRRHTPWPAVLLSGLMMVIVRFYGPATLDSHLFLYLLIAIMLIIRFNLSGRERQWREGKVQYGEENTPAFLWDGFIFAALVLTIAWLLPIRPIGSLTLTGWGPIRLTEWQVRFNNLFAALRGYRPGVQYTAFGNNLELGGPIDLTSEIVMLVQTPAGRYWRAMVYDEYDGKGWANTDFESEDLAPKAPLPREGREYLRKEITQKITLYKPTGGQLFATGEPLQIDLPVSARLRTYATWPVSSPENQEVSWERRAGVSTLMSKVPVTPDRPYTVASLISQAGEEELRAVTRLARWTVIQKQGNEFIQVNVSQDPRTLYPDWVTEKYLQLPADLPERIKDKALELTADYDSIYDRLVALETYLRQYTYDTTIATPPEESDAVDYFLFDLKKGYCNYFASAMVVMARSIGIPTRLAVGYAGGEYNWDQGGYEVRRSNTHAWVEAYFPGYGWIEFEPTPSQPSVVRGAQASMVPQGPPGRRVEGESETPLERRLREYLDQSPLGSSSRTFSLVGLLGWLLVIAIVVGILFAGFNWRRRTEASPTTQRIYGWMSLYSRLLAIPSHNAQTPTEYATLWAQKIPQERQNILRLAELYLKERFSPEGLSTSERTEANALWQDIRLAIRRRLTQRDVLAYWIKRYTPWKRVPKDSS